MRMFPGARARAVYIAHLLATFAWLALLLVLYVSGRAFVLALNLFARLAFVLALALVAAAAMSLFHGSTALAGALALAAGIVWIAAPRARLLKIRVQERLIESLRGQSGFIALAHRSEGSTIPPDEVQFTVYRPKVVRPGEWNVMLAFAHLADRRPEAPADDPDPIEQVRAQALSILGPQAKEFRDTSVEARQAVPREAEITLLPYAPGIEFNPERRAFRWTKDLHREQFDLRASADLDGKTARGRLSAYLGAILLAEIDLSIKVDSSHRKAPKDEPQEVAAARPFRKIFASYSHKDVEIVRQYETFVQTLGDRYLRDVRDLRSGEEWNEALLKLIDQADVFQLFWSNNAMRSEFVRREWEHALSLGRPFFVRPTYWENPFPESSDPQLPPEELGRIHFHCISAPPSEVPRGSAGLAKRRENKLRLAPSIPEKHVVCEAPMSKPASKSRGRAGMLAALLVAAAVPSAVVYYVRQSEINEQNRKSAIALADAKKAEALAKIKLQTNPERPQDELGWIGNVAALTQQSSVKPSEEMLLIARYAIDNNDPGILNRYTEGLVGSLKQPDQIDAMIKAFEEAVKSTSDQAVQSRLKQIGSRLDRARRLMGDAKDKDKTGSR